MDFPSLKVFTLRLSFHYMHTTNTCIVYVVSKKKKKQIKNKNDEEEINQTGPTV